MKKLDPALILLALAAFLAPIMGGYLDVATEAVSPGGSVFSGLFSYDACTLAHGFLGLLIFGSILVTLSKRQVVQVPLPRIITWLAIFSALMLLSVGLSEYKMLSLSSLAEWAMYGSGFMAANMIAGRWDGPRILAAAFVAGCALVSLAGFWEYVTQPDPTWRIMHYWQDPNALAGLLDLGLFAAIGLSYSVLRLKAAALLLCAGVIGSALLLTQSKGGLVAALAGFLIYFVAIGFYSRDRAGKRLLNLVMPIVLLIAITPGVQAIQKSAATPITAKAQTPDSPPTPTAQPSSPAPLGRLLNPASTAEQSAAFRVNLWKGCIWLIEKNPSGYGIGTYRFQSTKPGNTSETKLAHNSFLQLAVEINPLGALAFVVFLLLCAFEMLRSSSKLPERNNLFRMGIFVALLASAIHNVFDCDFYFTGTGLAFFILLGIGLTLSSDAILPELVKGPSKAVLLGIGALASFFLVYAGMVQLKLEWLRAEIATRAPEARSDAAALQGLCPFDYRVWYESVAAADSLPQAQQFALQSIENGPTAVGYHRLAQAYARQGEQGQALAALNKSLTLDPNNLEDLQTILQIEEQTDLKEAVKTAQRMVAIESTTYFTTRALPDVVPTETYEAREFLASQTSDAASRIQLLRPAVQGFLDFTNKTVPEIIRLASAGSSPFGSPTETVNKLNGAINGARQLEQAYGVLGDKAGAAWAATAEGTLTASLDGVGKILSSSK